MEFRPEPIRLSAEQRRVFALTQRAARQVLRRRFRLLRVTRDAYAKLDANERAMARVAADLRTMLRMARAWATREYQGASWKVLVYVVAAALYFLSPIDLIPDVLIGIGFVDDVAVITAVVQSVDHELRAFRKWEGAPASPGVSGRRSAHAAAA